LLRNRVLSKLKTIEIKLLSKMTTFKAGAIAGIMLAMISLSACKKPGDAPTSKTSQLSFQMVADNSTSSLAGSSLTTNSAPTGAAGLTFTTGTANISRFKLEARRNGVETEITSKNLTNVDLFALTPSIVNTTLDKGVYKEIEIKVVLQKTADTSAIPLKLKGTFADSQGTVIPVEFDLNDDVTIKAKAENIQVTSTTDFVALVHLHLLKLEAGIMAATLDAATLTNGMLIISSSSNTAIYNRVLANFSNCSEIEFREHHKGKDGNDDNGNEGSGHQGNDH
jgi:hypothetical protein